MITNIQKGNKKSDNRHPATPLPVLLAPLRMTFQALMQSSLPDPFSLPSFLSPSPLIPHFVIISPRLLFLPLSHSLYSFPLLVSQYLVVVR